MLGDVADYAIELDAVTKKFGDSQALRGVTFSTPVGSVLGVLGPNGAGKTTTINILSTLIRPSTGRALVGHDVVKQAKQVRADIGLTGQYAAVDELLTGRENLILFARLRGMKRRQADDRADEMLEAFSLTDAGGRRCPPTPAACGAASTSPAVLSCHRRWSSSTSRPRGSIRAAAARCGISSDR
jgi:ABC-2 type transport system ATP-binding protein